jgi:hypothetical protein
MFVACETYAVAHRSVGTVREVTRPSSPALGTPAITEQSTPL